MKKLLLLLTLVFGCLMTQAQGEITGKITDEYGEPVDGAVVACEGAGQQMMTYTDPEGFYSLKPLNAGTYKIVFSRTGYQSQQLNDVPLGVDAIHFLDIVLDLLVSDIKIVIRTYTIPLIDTGGAPDAITLDNEVITNLPSRDMKDAVALAPSVFQEDTGEPIYVRGARAGSTVYYVDGMRVSDATGVPISAVDQLSVLTGAIPAKYGDTTGGVVIMTLKSYR